MELMHSIQHIPVLNSLNLLGKNKKEENTNLINLKKYILTKKRFIKLHSQVGRCRCSAIRSCVNI